MNYTAVESSQIAEVGFGDGYYGPETLGIRFPPTKKQKAADEPGSEYHYKNISPEFYEKLLNAKTDPDFESIGKFFGKLIKPYPEKYPSVKVEAENPPQPPSSPNGGGKLSSTPNGDVRTSTGSSTSPPDGTEATSSTLAVIDTLTPDALFAPGGITDAQLAAGREWYLTEAKKYGIETEERRKELKRFVRDGPAKLRISVDKRAESFSRKIKDQYDAISGQKLRLTRFCSGLEAQLLRPLTEWEAEEEARKFNLSAKVGYLATFGQICGQHDVPWITSAIAALESYDISTMQEYKASAESAIAASLRVLKPELARRLQAEKDAAELAELRRKQAEREEADRKAEAQRQEDARIAEAAEKLAAKQVADAVEAARVETRQEVIAELAAPDTPDWMEPSEPEEIQPFVYPEIPAAPTLTDRRAIHAEVVQAFMGCSLTRQEALTVLQAIVDGKVPHVTVTY